MSDTGLTADQIRAWVDDHRADCHPDGQRHTVERTCPCLACVAICCEQCGQPVFAVPITGLPGCQHLDQLLKELGG